MNTLGDKSHIPEIKKAVADFLQTTLDEVHHVNVTKMAMNGPENPGWEVEAEIFVPNPTIKALGLPVSRPVLDKEVYAVHLDGALNILAFAPKDKDAENA